ncbi:hypothetical protein M758_5G097800 [Ceratodon purpureus]|nr:hypothetical protein M758_5G097800 [Ceratodon purpureus]
MSGSIKAGNGSRAVVLCPISRGQLPSIHAIARCSMISIASRQNLESIMSASYSLMAVGEGVVLNVTGFVGTIVVSVKSTQLVLHEMAPIKRNIAETITLALAVLTLVTQVRANPNATVGHQAPPPFIAGESTERACFTPNYLCSPPPPSSSPPPPRLFSPPPPRLVISPPPLILDPSPSPLLGPSPPPRLGPSPSPLLGAFPPGIDAPLVTTPAGASKSQAGLILGICAALLGAALIGLFLFCFLRPRIRLKSSVKPAQRANSGLPTDTVARPYTFKEIKNMTRNFSQGELLSSGAYGEVYKGTPPMGGRSLAVKRIKDENDDGEASFLAEVNSLRQIRHRNLLQLRGWCEAKEGMFLVYDYMCNSSLDKWLHPKPNPNEVSLFQNLTWNVRFSILSGVASGLEYLHEGWVQCVLHRDVKSSNVMLDADFNPYLGDFGLAGTLGYMAPEMHYTGKATKETDVYAFGVLVLEVVCGRRPFLHLQDGDNPGDFLLLDRVWRAHEAGTILQMVDQKLMEPDVEGSSHEQDELMASTLQWGLLCCLPNSSERPSMRLVHQWFQSREVGAVETPSLPATKPTAPTSTDRYMFTMPQSSEGTSSASQSSDTTRSSTKTNMTFQTSR